MDSEPSLLRFQRRLASFRRVIRFDRQGVGMSDPIAPTGSTALEQWEHDALAVMDAAGADRADLFASSDSATPAILLAATYPERISSLVLVEGTARVARDDDSPGGVPQRVLDRFMEAGFEPEALAHGFDQLALTAPSVAGDDTFRAWWDKAGYQGASPAMARAIQRVDLGTDVRALLPLLRVPTLIMHRRDDDIFRVGHGRYLAEHIPDAKYVELEGADHLYWTGDCELMLDEIEEFLTGVRTGLSAGPILATIMFTDIVSSTARLAEVGDSQWRNVIERQEMAARHQLQRYGGREIKTMGDGMLAIFDRPARAVHCACAIRDAAARIGLSVRVGVHAGEIEDLGDDVRGMAVHIAARVEARAKPGEVLVSRTVVDLVVGSGLQFTDRGNHVLKGVPNRWRLYCVEPSST